MRTTTQSEPVSIDTPKAWDAYKDEHSSLTVRTLTATGTDGRSPLERELPSYDTARAEADRNLENKFREQQYVARGPVTTQREGNLDSGTIRVTVEREYLVK